MQFPNSTLWTDEFLDSQRLIGDQPADEILQQIVASEGLEASRRIFDVLIRNIEMPLEQLPEIVKPYLAQTNRLPDWVDWQKVELAHELFLDHGPKFLVFLYYKSLPLLYGCKHGAQVLVRTSRLTHDQEDLKIFARRIAETGQFLLAVMTPAGLELGGEGIAAIQKVRLIHAAIRIFVNENWDIAQHGLPINQEDMALTLLTFSVTMADALEQFHIREDPAKLEAYIHTWAAIGALLGVKPELLAGNLADARALLHKILERQTAASDAGQLLTRALLGFGNDTLPQNFERSPEFMIQFLIGREKAQKLGIMPNYGCLAFLIPEGLRSFFRFGEGLEDKIDEPLAIFINQLSRKTALTMVNYFDQYKGRHFSIPERLKAAWFG